MTSTELVERRDAVISGLRSEKFQQQLALALPADVTAQRFARIAITAIQQNPDIVTADPDSIVQSLLRCAADGLLPDGREAALTKFRDNKAGVDKAQYMPMIGGFRKIAAEFGWAISTAVVYANDEFDFSLGLEERLEHRPARPGVDRGGRIAAYAVGRHRDGRRLFEVMYANEIEKVRGVSRSKDRGPWVDWTDRMWEKTVGRRLFAKLPLDPNDKRVASLLESSIDGDQATRALYGPTSPTSTPPAALPAATGDGVGDRVLQDGGASSDRREHPDVVVNQQADRGGASSAPEGSAAAAPGTDTAAEPIIDGDDGYNPPQAVADNEVVLAAQQAAMFVPPNGQHAKAGRSLGGIHALGDKGLGWFKWALSQDLTPDAYRTAVWNFCRVYTPDLHQAELARRETQAAA